LAAQESKALEDLNSAFYFTDSSFDSSQHDENHEHVPRHIVPWPLRVLAVRLQSIGFGDSRRSIAGLYELGMEARREVLKHEHDDATRKIWKDRLADLGIRTVNALVEMGDLDAAKRSLESLREPAPESDIMKLRKGLLFLRIGDVDAAERVFSDPRDSKEAALLRPLLSMSDGRYSDAADEWRSLQEDNTRTDGGLIAQNLAVCLLYTGKLDQARELLESSISANHSFGSLIFNLSTVYELCSDSAGQLKGQLAGSIANQPMSGQTNLDRSNTDFKL
jgi:tetratricopeptide (TPR) repeat protein